MIQNKHSFKCDIKMDINKRRGKSGVKKHKHTTTED